MPEHTDNVHAIQKQCDMAPDLGMAEATFLAAVFCTCLASVLVVAVECLMWLQASGIIEEYMAATPRRMPTHGTGPDFNTGCIAACLCMTNLEVGLHHELCVYMAVLSVDRVKMTKHFYDLIAS